jgi:hypothetical protein
MLEKSIIILMVILLISILILIIVADGIRESKRKKWYIEGYIDACEKYDENQYRNKPHRQEAEKKFHDKYGFDYD